MEIDNRFYVTQEGFCRIGYSANIHELNIEELNEKITSLPKDTIVQKVSRKNNIEEYILILDFPVKTNTHLKGLEIMNSINWFNKIDSEELILNYFENI